MSEFARIASPLNALLKKDAVFNWTADCKAAFGRLKEVLVSTPVLSYLQFDGQHPFLLETNARTHGLGAVLAQEQRDGKVHPIVFTSRSLSPAEQQYSITELETLGLVWAVRLFRPYILGHRCIVFTDHATCTSLLTAKNPSSKQVRWAMSIQDLDLDNHCRLSLWFSYLEDGRLPVEEGAARRLVLEQDNYEVLDGVLYTCNPSGPEPLRVVIPQCLQQTLMKEYNNSKFTGHLLKENSTPH